MSEKPEKIWLIWVTKNVRWSEKPDQRFPYDLGYIRSDIVEKMLTEQREACADVARSEVMDWEGVSVSEGMANAVAKMVSNARVEKNEGKRST